jgi:hypothetical protein
MDEWQLCVLWGCQKILCTNVCLPYLTNREHIHHRFPQNLLAVITSYELLVLNLTDELKMTVKINLPLLSKLSTHYIAIVLNICLLYIVFLLRVRTLTLHWRLSWNKLCWNNKIANLLWQSYSYNITIVYILICYTTGIFRVLFQLAYYTDMLFLSPRNYW